MKWNCSYEILFFGFLLSVSLSKGSRYLLRREIDETNTSSITWIGMGMTMYILWIYGVNGRMLSSILFFHILLFASAYDIKTHSIPDYVHLMILLTGLISVHWVSALLGLFFVPLPLLIAAIVSHGKMGGGDIKFMAVCGFVLGVSKGYTALIAGLLLAVLWNLCFCRKSRRIVPLIPYFTCGCFLSLFI